MERSRDVTKGKKTRREMLRILIKKERAGIMLTEEEKGILFQKGREGVEDMGEWEELEEVRDRLTKDHGTAEEGENVKESGGGSSGEMDRKEAEVINEDVDDENVVPLPFPSSSGRKKKKNKKKRKREEEKEVENETAKKEPSSDTVDVEMEPIDGTDAEASINNSVDKGDDTDPTPVNKPQNETPASATTDATSITATAACALFGKVPN